MPPISTDETTASDSRSQYPPTYGRGSEKARSESTWEKSTHPRREEPPVYSPVMPRRYSRFVRNGATDHMEPLDAKQHLADELLTMLEETLANGARIDEMSERRVRQAVELTELKLLGQVWRCCLRRSSPIQFARCWHTLVKGRMLAPLASARHDMRRG